MPEDAEALAPLVKLFHGGGAGYALDLLSWARGRGVGLSRWEDLNDAWKGAATEDNRLGRRCLLRVDATDAVWWRAGELRRVVDEVPEPVATRSRGRAWGALAAGGLLLAGIFAWTAADRR